jgi:hypothetical protein
MLHPHHVDVLCLLHATNAINKRLIGCEVYVLCITCSVPQLGHKVIQCAPFVLVGSQGSRNHSRESIRCETTHHHFTRGSAGGTYAQHPCLAITATPSHIGDDYVFLYVIGIPVATPVGRGSQGTIGI